MRQPSACPFWSIHDYLVMKGKERTQWRPGSGATQEVTSDGTDILLSLLS
jgi:hypothetical protein